MNKLALLLTALCAVLPVPGLANATQPKIAIIKADDVRRPTEQWQRFVDVSRDKGVKVSLGVICDSLADPSPEYVTWLRDLDQSSQVELWQHGWDHKHWTDAAGNALREFRGSGFAHQHKHYHEAKAAMTRVLGRPPLAFGAPYNAMDDDTFKIINADADMRLVFAYNDRGLEEKIPAMMTLRGEHDGTGKPNFEKFKADYAKKSDLHFAAIQFHPQNFAEEHFEEYLKILDFLLTEGWQFMLPREYVAAHGVAAKWTDERQVSPQRPGGRVNRNHDGEETR